MANWTFGASEQGWTLNDGAEWDGAEGQPPGSLHMPDVLANAAIGSLSIAVNPGDAISYDYRVTISQLSGEVTGGLTVGVGPASQFHFTIPVGYSVPYDSGWVHVSDTMSDAGTITTLSLSQDASDIYVETWYDNIYINETPAAGNLYHSQNGIPGAILI